MNITHFYANASPEPKQECVSVVSCWLVVQPCSSSSGVTQASYSTSVFRPGGCSRTALRLLERETGESHRQFKNKGHLLKQMAVFNISLHDAAQLASACSSNSGKDFCQERTRFNLQRGNPPFDTNHQNQLSWTRFNLNDYFPIGRSFVLCVVLAFAVNSRFTVAIYCTSLWRETFTCFVPLDREHLPHNTYCAKSSSLSTLLQLLSLMCPGSSET